MNRHRESRSVRTTMAWVIGIALVAFATGWLWWWMRAPIQLDEDGYAITLALYRVCNQRSDDGLDQIESLLSDSSVFSDEPSAAGRAIRSIIDDARQEQWQRATKDCRRLLEQQVTRWRD